MLLIPDLVSLSLSHLDASTTTEKAGQHQVPADQNRAAAEDRGARLRHATGIRRSERLHRSQERLNPP